MLKKIYVVGDSNYYFSFIEDSELTDNMELADIVLFTGGEDITPSYYNEERNIYTHSNKFRDEQEAVEFYKAISLNKMLIGICRGAQFLTVMSGGKLIQHVDNHAIGFPHQITFGDTYAVYPITSTHHQMMYPYEMDSEDYKIIAVSTENRSSMYLGAPGKKYTLTEEPEIVYYPRTKSLGIQGHPESMKKDDSVVLKINSLIYKLLKDGIE